MIYLDNSATTPLDKDVLGDMLPYLTQHYGNPQSQHSAGRYTANAVIAARDGTAELIGCKPEEVYFLSGGTEAGNTALKGVLNSCGSGHAVVSAIEHPALIESAKDMQKRGFEITFINAGKDGVISPQSVKDALRKDTVFCAVMSANNETGVIQPVKEIGGICRQAGVFYYCDCVQSAGVLPFPAGDCDSLALSAHKFYGPHGVGAMYIKQGSRISRLISGGMQERNFRGGTQYTAGIVGLYSALKKAVRDAQENNRKIAALRDRFIDMVASQIDGAHLNGGRQNRLPCNANFSFDGCDGANILFALDIKGVCVSTGSACSAGAVTPSHVLLAMGLSEDRAKSAVRFTFGKYNTKEEVDFTVNALKEVVLKIRNIR